MADELIAVGVYFVASNFKIREKTFNRLFEGNAVSFKLIIVEVIFKIRRIEAASVHHESKELLSLIATERIITLFILTQKKYSFRRIIRSNQTQAIRQYRRFESGSPNTHKAELKIENWKVQIFGKRRFKNSRFILYLQALYDLIENIQPIVRSF